MSRNRFASTVVTSLEWQAALEQQCHDLASSFASGVDLLVVFVSPHFQPELEEIVGVLTAVLSPRHMIGSTGESIVADAVEIEGTPAI